MPSIRNILSTTLLLALLSPAFAATPEELARDREAGSDIEQFQKLLDQVDPPSLHVALHNYSPKKFKHGMFKEDSVAVKEIHKSEPEAAHSIIELAKRQDSTPGNATVVTSTGPATTTVPIESPSPSGPVTPVPPITTNSIPAFSSSNTEAATSSAASVAPTTEASSSAAASTTLISSTSGPSTTSAPSSSLTNGEVISSTDASGDVIVSTVGGGVRTITPSGSGSSSKSSAPSSHTSTLVSTSTLPDGSQSTITAVTVVGASAGAGSTPTGTAGEGESKTGSAPGLQTGEAVMTRGFGREGVVVLAAAVGFAVLM